MITAPVPKVRQQGISLIEVVLAVILLGLLGTVGSKMLTGSISTTRIINDQHLANSTARYALERMARDIREISYNTATVPPTHGISSMSDTQLTFTKSGLNGSSTNVNFSYASNVLSMTSGGITSSLAESVAAPSTTSTPPVAKIFTYLDATQTEITDYSKTSNVYFVRLSLTLAPANAQSITLNTLIRLRNI